MKKLIYTFTFLLFIFSLTSCSTQDPIEDISIEIPEGETLDPKIKSEQKTAPKKKIKKEATPF